MARARHIGMIVICAAMLASSPGCVGHRGPAPQPDTHSYPLPPTVMVRAVPAAPPSSLPPSSLPAPAPLPPDAGAYRKCAACHSLEPGRHGIGPSLAGVYGRAAGRAAGFRYSEQLLASGAVWTPAALDRFLTDPRAMVPGTKMTIRGLASPAERAQIIALLQRY